ncbi:MAG: acyl carrier protein [Acidobacteria bacterium]|nr:MAG: acyl carrier protein [Acidobacteriota bacterium]
MTPRTFDRAEAAREIHAKVVELARARGIRVTGFRDNEVIPETNLLDSAGIMELIVWYETRFDLAIEQADLTIENFGTVNAMVDYLARA